MTPDSAIRSTLSHDPARCGTPEPRDVLGDITRRQLFATCGIGLGKIALSSLLATSAARRSFADVPPTEPAKATAAPTRDYPMGLHYPMKAKRVIYLFMAGAPSQLDLFDYKPKLVEWEGKPLPPEVIAGQRYAFIQPNAAVLGPRFTFAKHGQSGAELSEVLPHTAKIVDDLAIIRSVHTNQFNHAPAQLMFNTGSGIPGRPSMGSWLSYGIGSEANDLPSFVVLTSGGSLSGGAAMWG